MTTSRRIDSKTKCDHLVGYDVVPTFSGKPEIRLMNYSSVNYELCVLFKYCPACGKKNVLYHQRQKERR